MAVPHPRYPPRLPCREPQRRPMFHRIFRADTQSVRDTLLGLRQRFAPLLNEDALARLELALAEVLNNIGEHGTTGSGDAPKVHICVVRQGAGLACAVTDDGLPLPEACLVRSIGGSPMPTTAQGELPEGGFGWFLIHNLTRAICYYRENQRNFLAFTIPITEEEVS